MPRYPPLAGFSSDRWLEDFCFLLQLNPVTKRVLFFGKTKGPKCAPRNACTCLGPNNTAVP